MSSLRNELLQLALASRKSRSKLTLMRYWLARKYNWLLDATYWKWRNWNWRAPNPRGFTSRHGYADTVELIPGQMFALFMRYYEEEYQTQAYLYTQDDLNKKLSDPGSFIESAELIQRHLVFQKRVEWVANWVRTVYDTWDDQPDWTLEKEEVYCRDMRKAMHIIVKYHGWMWT